MMYGGYTPGFEYLTLEQFLGLAGFGAFCMLALFVAFYFTRK